MAKSSNRVTQWRDEVEKMRKNYSEALVSTNKAVYAGMGEIANQQLTAVKKHYEEALKSLQTLRKGGTPRELAGTQLQMLQDALDRTIKDARETLDILEKTRTRVSEELRKSNDAATDTGPSTRTTRTAAKHSTAAKKKPATAAKRSTSSTAKRTTTAAKNGTGSKTTAKKSTGSKRTSSTAKGKTAAKSTASKRTTTAKSASSKTGTRSSTGKSS